MTLTRTHTKTFNLIEFADPYKTCNMCGAWVDGVLDARKPINMPCEHQTGYTDRCPSWGPVDGCQCVEHLGHRPHLERSQTS